MKVLFIKQHSNSVFFLTLGSMALGFMWLLRNSTLNGSGLINDSIAYIAGARSILAGTGYSQVWLATELQPITHYPPLFSLVLSFVGLFGVDPLLSARMVNTLLLGVNIVLTGILGWRIFEDRFAGFLLAFLFTISGAIFRVHSYAISEPLFLFFCLAGFLFLEFHFMNRGKVWIVCLGITVGLAILDRYVGFVLFGVIAAVLVLFENTWRSRLKGLGIYLISSAPLPFAWLIYNFTLTGIMADRGLNWHPVTTENLLLGIANFSHWLLPMDGLEADQIMFFLPGAFLLISFGSLLLVWLVVGTVRMLKGLSSSLHLNPVVYTAGAFAWIYPLSVLISISLFDPTTKLQDRILTPAYLSLMIVLVGFGIWLWRLGKPMVRAFAIFAGILLLGFWSRDFHQTVQSMQRDGQGYASRRIRESSVIRFIDEIPWNIAIYTDSPPSIYSGTGRPSFVVSLGSEEEQHLKYYLLINEKIRSGEATLVLFDTNKYHDPVSQANYHMLTMGSKMIIKFGTQRAFMGEEE